jgi:hypothetical protein
MNHYLIADLAFECRDPERDTDEAFDAFTDAVADELLKLAEIDTGIIDPDVTVVISDRWVSILMGVVADTRNDAVRLFSANVRCALHTAGCATPGWPTFEPTQVSNVRTADFIEA